MTMTYTDYINNLLELIWEYIRDIVNFDNEYRKILSDLKKSNNGKIIKTKEMIEYEKEIKRTYEKASGLYEELTWIARNYSYGTDVREEVEEFCFKVNTARLPIYNREMIQQIAVNQIKGTPTGAAAEVIEDKIGVKSISKFERGEPMNFEQAGGSLSKDRRNPAGSHTNPKFLKNKNFQRNCQVCVVVFEARMRGYNIEALPLDDDNKIMTELRQNPENAFIDPKTGKPPIKLYAGFTAEKISHDNVIDWLMQKIKQNERYGFICTIEAADKTLYQHILIVRKVKKIDRNKKQIDVIMFYDPQNGYEVEAIYFDKIRYKRKDENGILEGFNPKIFRIDNADININYLNKIAKKHR